MDGEFGSSVVETSFDGIGNVFAAAGFDLETVALRATRWLARVTGISDRLLSERLRELETAGIVRREVSPGPPVRVSYELTCSGHELEPALSALEAWAAKWISLDALQGV